METYSKEHENDDFGEAYKNVLNNKTKVKQIFEIFANSKGAVLFHCTAGKDITGIIAALILGLCDVPDLDIIANYQVANTYISKSTFLNAYANNVQKSEPKFMQTFISRLKEEYKSYENYLLSCDIAKEDLDKIKAKFLEPFKI